ncbi:hypothetical protein K438DRAFT_2101236 [Mycena galopus ATCC 62051]|nr:hypothetical protein K438DRAFT_2101236 [Mycena galopus ATCC 62051]
MSDTTPDRRSRVYIACLNCRRRKTKCETNYPGDPCKRCSRTGLACEYIPIRHQQGQIISARAPVASGYDSGISQQMWPAPQALPSHSTETNGSPPLSPQSAQWGSTSRVDTTRATESGPSFAHYPGGQPVHPENHPYFVPAQGYSDSGHDSHPLPYSAPPHPNGSVAYSSQFPAYHLACSQSQPCIHGGLCGCGVGGQTSHGFMRG